jgi:pimeloyl-ACP methyl ester carboxylesterase
VSTGYAQRLGGWPASAGAVAQDLRYPRPGAGGETAALRLTPAAGPIARAVVAHGAGNDAVYLLLELFAALLRERIEVFAFDLDGHGTGSTTVFDPEGVRGCVAAAVAAAERGADALPLHLVGHSLGGALALDALASGSLPSVRSAAVLSAPLSVRIGPRTVIGELRGFLRPETLSQRRLYGLWGLVPAFGPVRRASFPFRLARPGRGAFGYVHSVRAFLRAADLERRAGEVPTPTLLVYGDADHLAGHADGRRLAAALPNAELDTLPGVSHYGIAFHPGCVRRTASWAAAHSVNGG